MQILLGIGSILILALSFYLWPKDQRSLKTVLITALIICSITVLGIIFARSLPITRQEKVEKVVMLKRVKPPQVIYQDRVVYRAPDGEVAPVDVKAACEGKVPLQLVKIDEQTETQTDEDKEAGKKAESTTWILAHPIGSKVLITCGQPGAYASFWKVGDVVQIVRGVPQ